MANVRVNDVRSILNPSVTRLSTRGILIYGTAKNGDVNVEKKFTTFDDAITYYGGNIDSSSRRDIERSLVYNLRQIINTPDLNSIDDYSFVRINDSFEADANLFEYDMFSTNDAYDPLTNASGAALLPFKITRKMSASVNYNVQLLKQTNIPSGITTAAILNRPFKLTVTNTSNNTSRSVVIPYNIDNGSATRQAAGSGIITPINTYTLPLNGSKHTIRIQYTNKAGAIATTNGTEFSGGTTTDITRDNIKTAIDREYNRIALTSIDSNQKGDINVTFSTPTGTGNSLVIKYKTNGIVRTGLRILLTNNVLTTAHANSNTNTFLITSSPSQRLPSITPLQFVNMVRALPFFNPINGDLTLNYDTSDVDLTNSITANLTNNKSDITAFTDGTRAYGFIDPSTAEVYTVSSKSQALTSGTNTVYALGYTPHKIGTTDTVTELEYTVTETLTVSSDDVTNTNILLNALALPSRDISKSITISSIKRTRGGTLSTLTSSVISSDYGYDSDNKINIPSGDVAGTILEITYKFESTLSEAKTKSALVNDDPTSYYVSSNQIEFGAVLPYNADIKYRFRDVYKKSRDYNITTKSDGYNQEITFVSSKLSNTNPSNDNPVTITINADVVPTIPAAGGHVMGSRTQSFKLDDYNDGTVVSNSEYYSVVNSSLNATIHIRSTYLFVCGIYINDKARLINETTGASESSFINWSGALHDHLRKKQEYYSNTIAFVGFNTNELENKNQSNKLVSDILDANSMVGGVFRATTTSRVTVVMGDAVNNSIQGYTNQKVNLALYKMLYDYNIRRLYRETDVALDLTYSDNANLSNVFPQLTIPNYGVLVSNELDIPRISNLGVSVVDWESDGDNNNFIKVKSNRTKAAVNDPLSLFSTVNAAYECIDIVRDTLKTDNTVFYNDLLLSVIGDDIRQELSQFVGTIDAPFNRIDPIFDVENNSSGSPTVNILVSLSFIAQRAIDSFNINATVISASR